MMRRDQERRVSLIQKNQRGKIMNQNLSKPENNEESAENEMPESGTQAADKQPESAEGQGGPRHGHYTRLAAQGLEARMRWL